MSPVAGASPPRATHRPGVAPKTQGGIINEYVDLFAGSGGWDLAAQRMGLEGTGLELNADACKTRKAAGFATYEGDLRHRMSYHLNEQGLIASPPCQSFSMAGKGKGREEMDKILDTIRSWSWAPKEPFADPNTGLILEPLRWIMNRAACNRNFRWIAMEQVVPCLPIWQAYATLLEEIGYFTAVGIVNAEQHGVPQTRRRAVLMAHWDRNVFLPKPTLETPIGFAEALGLEGDWSLVSNTSQGATKMLGVRKSPEPSFTLTGRCTSMRLVEGHLPGLQPRASGVGRRVTIAEAGILQSFPRDFPWSGTLGSVRQQIGNAIPPLMAQAVLEALIDI